MVSCPWSPIKRISLAAILVFSATGYSSNPVMAESAGSCQAAYGQSPSSLPEWLKLAEEDMDLNTTNRYDLLSGKLLSSGLVDGSSCPD